ncbi:hypothetical protein BJX99DRAFT_126711 [Aspergillus californicus]
MSSGPDLYQHQSVSSAITAVHVDGQNADLLIVDRPIEPQTIAAFVSFCSTGILPNGKKTSLEILTPDEARLADTSPDTDDNDLPIIERVMVRIGSFEDGARMCKVGKNIQSMKNRAWAGIVPFSEQRWKEKGLDRSENFDMAAEYLSAVLAVFEYLNQPRVAKNMRDTFNLISAHWGEFEEMINSRRAGEGEQLRVSVTKLWAEFMAAHFEVVTERAHRWVIVHVNALREPLLNDLSSHRPISLDSLDRMQWKVTDRLHTLAEIAGVADYTILIPMYGYIGYTAPLIPSGVPIVLRSSDYNERQKAYGPHLKTMTRTAQIEALRARHQREDRLADPIALTLTARRQIECQNRLRKQIRGDPIEPMPKEPWIMDDLRMMQNNGRRERGYGFVIYRLTYGQTHAQWTAFRRKMEAHVSDWGRGQTGSKALQPHLKLHWRDGKALGIAEGDVQAANKHYLEKYPEDNLLFAPIENINMRAFLAVDAPSYESYMGLTYTAATDHCNDGDFTGFVLAIDPGYDPKEGPNRPEESPGFQGQMRILGSLVWGELYAMLSSQSAILEDIWPLALDHPNQVYVGPVVPTQTEGWRTQNVLRAAMMRGVIDYAKAKIEGKAWPPPTESRPPAQFQRSTPTTNPAQRLIPMTLRTDPPRRSQAPQSTPTSDLFDYEEATTRPPRQQHRSRRHQPTTAPSGPLPTADLDPFDFEEATTLPEPPDMTDPIFDEVPQLGRLRDLVNAVANREDGSLRTYMLTEFARSMREQGEPRQAVIAEELLRIPAGARPDMERVRQGIEEEERIGNLPREWLRPPGSDDENGGRDGQEGTQL